MYFLVSIFLENFHVSLVVPVVLLISKSNAELVGFFLDEELGVALGALVRVQVPLAPHQLPVPNEVQKGTIQVEEQTRGLLRGRRLRDGRLLPIAAASFPLLALISAFSFIA